MARPVPVPGPGPRRAGRDVRLRPVSGRAGRAGPQDRRAHLPALAAITAALAGADVAHFDETGFRVAGKLAWAHSASAGKFVLVTVHPKRGKEGMDAAGVPAFTRIACHDA